MNTNPKIIIYDHNCPMCAAYTSAFMQAGLIEKEGRKNFDTIQPEMLALVDIKRSMNEIPLIDSNTKQVWYGVDALLEILSQRLPVIKSMGNARPVKWLLLRIYKFISYNRKVIVANRLPADSFDCSPDFNLRYRIIFMIVFPGF